jgi:hypothetical protein
LTKDGASIRVWKDSHAKLRTLAALRGQQQAVVFDALVHNALQAEYDQMESEDAEQAHPPKG